MCGGIVSGTYGAAGDVDVPGCCIEADSGCAEAEAEVSEGTASNFGSCSG